MHENRFVSDERGEMAPAGYLIAILLALVLIFFTLDLGLRKGARLAVEYAAYCGARAAATQMPRGDREGACLSSAEYEAIKLAASACLASVVSKEGTARPDVPGSGALPALIARASRKVKVRVLGAGGEVGIGRCLGRDADVGVEVRFDHHLPIPMSPFNWDRGGHVEMVAEAHAMLQTVK